MKQAVLTLIMIFLVQSKSFALGNGKSKTYDQLIAEYKNLENKFPGTCRLLTAGPTDCGKNLNLFVISGDGNFDAQNLKQKKCIVFINNGIHAGEPDGMEASLRFADSILSSGISSEIMKTVVFCIVPVYNIDGALNRSCCSRANQNGPEEYGFRGNSRNLDLNRDFIKADALNTHSLIKLLRDWDPDIFIDTHVSDGADYQYTMTVIPTQHNKANPIIGSYMKNNFTPAIFSGMIKLNNEASPYVETYDASEIPDSGITDFLETPRFASGYQILFNCISYITEAHMLKPFEQRVQATYDFLNTIATLAAAKAEEIKLTRKKANQYDQKLKNYPFNYELDSTRFEKITFKGYKAIYKQSKVTDRMRLFYDRTQPFTKQVNYYTDFIASDSTIIPTYYLIPQAWKEVIQILSNNQIEMKVLLKDSSISAEYYYIDAYENTEQPYEGHFQHYNTKTRSIKKVSSYLKGDIIVPTSQPGIRFIMEALEPRAHDSFFSWGFFDSILQQKEWFANYVFEELAEEILKNDIVLQRLFDSYKKENPSSDEFLRLYFIYRHSSYFEPTYHLYPVARINN